jgi:hypothetical protein
MPVLFCQLGPAHSLREITRRPRGCKDKLKLLDITDPGRSTLAYAHEGWPLPLTTLSKNPYVTIRGIPKPSKARKSFRFKNKLVALDSSIIDLYISLFDQARFRRTKGAIKFYLHLDHDGYLPSYSVITEGPV